MTTMAKEAAALVKVDETFKPLKTPEQLGDVLTLNLGEGESVGIFDLERIRIPSGGGKVFEAVSEEGESEGIGTSFEALVIYFRDVRTFYKKSFDESGGGRPDCSSDDKINGFGDNGTVKLQPASNEVDPEGVLGGSEEVATTRLEYECRTCPQNQWGSARKGRGKACAEQRMLFLLREGREEFFFPSLLMVPPTSLRGVRKHFIAIGSQALPYFAVVHTLSLKHARNAAGQDYSQLVVTTARKLTDGELAKVKAYSEAMQGPLMGVRAEDAGTTNSDD